MKRIATIMSICLPVLMLSFQAVRATQINTNALEAAGRKYGISRSDIDELVRLYRGAVNAGVSARRLDAILDQALDNDLEMKYLSRALILCTNVALNGLPSQPILNKFSEGLAKRVRDRELIEALENRALSLKKARQLLSVVIYEDKPMGELDFVLIAVASALERGVTESEIESLIKDKKADLKKLVLQIEELK